MYLIQNIKLLTLNSKCCRETEQNFNVNHRVAVLLTNFDIIIKIYPTQSHKDLTLFDEVTHTLFL